MLIVRSCWLIEVANHAKDGRLQFIGGRRAALNQFAVLVVVPGFLCFLVGEPVTYFGHIFRLCLDIGNHLFALFLQGLQLALENLHRFFLLVFKFFNLNRHVGKFFFMPLQFFRAVWLM